MAVITFTNEYCMCRVTFKRKRIQNSRFSNSISGLFPNRVARLWGQQSGEEASPLRPYGETGGNENLGESKDGFPLDWYVEGPGRRVGYEDLTAIDWIFEYTKERQRKRLLYARGQGILGYIRQLLDGSQLWFVLIATGISVGVIAAAIDIATNWLGDIKIGYCKSGEGGGRFYLNRSFCCWGYDGKLCACCGLLAVSHSHLDLSQCFDWTPWRKALKVNSASGGYVVEYIFYVLYSVGIFLTLVSRSNGYADGQDRYFSLCARLFLSGVMLYMHDTVGFLKLRRFLEALL